MTTIHEPVLLKEVLEYLNPQPNQNFVDCTFGGGGHAAAILEKIAPKGKLIGIDWDPQVVSKSHNPNLILVNDNYKNLIKIINDSGINKIHGILLDLGLSSDQLEARDRGFSFQKKEFLDLRYNPQSLDLTAAAILKTYSEQELIKIFQEYGEEPLAQAIAKKIIAKRRNGQAVETTDMLVQLVSETYQKKFKTKSRKNPAARVFQSLRIAVNDEFGNLKSVLPPAIKILAPGGRLAIISFHSGEDRIVKHFFKNEIKKQPPKIKILTKRPITPSEREIKENPRSRSSKLRVIEKI